MLRSAKADSVASEVSTNDGSAITRRVPALASLCDVDHAVLGASALAESTAPPLNSCTACMEIRGVARHFAHGALTPPTDCHARVLTPGANRDVVHDRRRGWLR